MAEVEEPQFTSLSARIAALNQSQAARPYNAPATAGKRPPPPPPPTQAPQRPQPDFRSKSVNNPPTFGFTVDKQYNNEPAGTKTLAILPPPPVDRDTPQPSPQLQGKAKPPQLPRRDGLQVPPQNSITPRASPSLPPRRPSGSGQLTKRTSNESMMSVSSSISAFSIGNSGASSTTSTESNVGRKLPPCLEQASLPSLPPSKRELAAKAQQEKDEKKAAEETKRIAFQSSKSSSAVPQLPLRTPSYQAQTPLAIMPAHSRSPGLPPRSSGPSLPPRLPSRATAPARVEDESTPPLMPSRRLPPTIIPPMPARPTGKASAPAVEGPPPVPRSSRPTASQIEASRAAAASVPPLPGGMYAQQSALPGCLICRDFSGPDQVAAQYPRQSLPHDPTSYLASVLCSPFDSPTDKARAIFTWLHHNIDYDTESFFNGTVKGETPETSISRGLAVCGGYASVYSAIALKAGLECVMVTGHGKGFGYADMKAGDPVPPPDPTGHAWNAVRIDNGHWKLLDACWGAGQLNTETNRYNRNLADECFTMSNEDFGLRHYPANESFFFRADGRRLSWDEYVLGPNGVVNPPQVYGNVGEHGINKESFMPITKAIDCRTGGMTHFQFSKKCEHWDFLRNGKTPGKPYVMILQYNGIDGREKDFMPFEFDGTYWYLDIETRKLGCRPMKVNVYAVTTVDGRDARGWTKAQYLAAKGRKGMGFAGIAMWELV